MRRVRAFNRLCAVALLVAAQPVVARAQRGCSTGVSADHIFPGLSLREGSAVGEIGAGDGELTLAAARLVGPSGKVYSSELGEKRVRELEDVVRGASLPQVSVVAGDPLVTNFPESCCDAIFMRDVYHHFADPAAMNASILRSLRPGGRLAVVDFTPPPGSDEVAPSLRSKDGTHGIRPATLARELEKAGFVEISTEVSLNRWYVLMARKPASPRESDVD